MFEFQLLREDERRPQRVRPSLSFEKIETSEPYMGQDMFQEKFSLKMTLGTEFWSNKAQLEHKQAHAMKVIYAHLFKDMIPLVDEIICDADDEDVRVNAIRLKKLMVPS